jgi:hypothetical protein
LRILFKDISCIAKTKPEFTVTLNTKIAIRQKKYMEEIFMKKLITFCLITILFAFTNAYSKEVEKISPDLIIQDIVEATGPDTRIRDINVGHLFGVSASSVSGVGLSYMYYITPNYHFKATGIYYRNREEKENELNQKGYNDTIFADAGLELRKNFAVIKKPNTTFQFYTLVGGGYWYYKKERPFSPENNKEQKLISGGLGLGTGFLFINKIALNIDFSYQYTTGINYGFRRTGIGAGISCYVAY